MYERLSVPAGKRAADNRNALAPSRPVANSAPVKSVPPQRTHRLTNVADPVEMHAPADGPTIQRVVIRGGGTRVRDIDLVNTVTGFVPFGVTTGEVNNVAFPGGNAAQAVVAPKLLATQADNGRTEVRVAAEPVNVVDYRMELPAGPPWQRDVAKGQLVPWVDMVAGKAYQAQYDTLRASPTDQTAFRVAGAPSDDGFAALVETHEDQHVADLWRTTGQILEPWDANLRLLRNTDSPIEAIDEGTATAELYRTVGGTPAEIGQRILSDIRDKGNAFHETARGGKPTVSSVTATANPNTMTLTWRHPMG